MASLLSVPLAGAHGSPCRSGEAASALTWIRPPASEERARLEPWCRAVGPPEIHAPPGAGDPAPVDEIAVVVWNTHVGAAEIRSLITDLRSGGLSGGAPVGQFVLLLQEVHRRGPAVPLAPSMDAAWAGRIGGWSDPVRMERDPRTDIVDLAREEGLHLLYVPSMRNGSPHDGGALEDRGNAILSTLPLEDLTAIELPVERQRRVAVAATVEVRTENGIPHRIRFVSAHLENRAPWTRMHRSFGATQTSQARALVAALERLPRVAASAVGGDFNTWFRGGSAAALDALRVRYPSLGMQPDGATKDLPLFLPGLRLDHLFFRLPPGWAGRYEILPDRYGSDHAPLLGWLRMDRQRQPPPHTSPVTK